MKLASRDKEMARVARAMRDEPERSKRYQLWVELEGLLWEYKDLPEPKKVEEG